MCRLKSSARVNPVLFLTFTITIIVTSLIEISSQSPFANQDQDQVDNKVVSPYAQGTFKDFYGKERLVWFQPRHIHIAYGDDPLTQMTITWSTIDDTNGSAIVEYGRKHLAENNATGTVTKFVATGDLKLTQYVHRVFLRNLLPGTTYLYHCGSDMGWSEIFYFSTMKPGNDWSPHLAVYGDLGNDNAQSLVRLQREVHLGVYDAIIHVGDFAYDMDSSNGQVGDAFMDQIQPIAAYLPYMVCPGNHEYRDNFHQYKNRFTMPGKYNSMMYSWNMGPIHFVSISTEFYYFLQYGITPVIRQYEWLQRDLAEANKPENRKVRPWIITYGHRPMYCSNADSDDCTKKETLVRVGIPYIHWYGLEDMFMNYGVDLSIWAHEHSYERLWPIYNRRVYNGSVEEPYKNPKAITHVTTGSAGCSERHDPFPIYKPDWAAFRSTDYGYSRIKAINHTHLSFEQVSEDLDGKIIDSFILIRENHEPYPIPKKMESVDYYSTIDNPESLENAL